MARAQADVHASATVHAVQQGADVKLVVLVEIDEGWHLYHGPTEADIGEEGAVGQPTTVEISGAGFAFGDWRWSEPETKTQDFGDGPVKVYEHVEQLRLWLRGVAEPGAKLEDIRVQVKGLTCENGDGGVCTPYDETKSVEGAGVEALWKQFPADLTATKAPPKPVANAAGAGDGAAAATDYGSGDTEGQALWAFLLSAVLWGLFTLLMPCTYPMIPITFSFFTKQADARGGKVLSLALAYGFGIVAMFTFVGAAMSGVIIRVVNHWATNAVIGVFFVFFAFALFGWINLNPPQSLQRLSTKASKTGGLLGVFFMGATLVITSFTCTAPIVGTLLAVSAEHGWQRAAFGMSVFGLTMAIPFVFLALMPTKVKAMPKSGEWMETLKVSLGFVELAAALKFVSMVDFALGWQILPRELFLLIWTAIFGLWALFLFGILRKAGSGPNEGVGGGRMATGMLVTMFAAYFFFGALGNKLDAVLTGFIPGYSNSIVSRVDGGKQKKDGHELVYDNPAEAVRVAQAQDKLLIYNFTGFN